MTTGVGPLYYRDMPRVRPEIIAGKLYHVYNRGVEKRVIFPTQGHYSRFISALRFFNTTTLVTLRDFFSQTAVRPLHEGERLVDVGAFILMPTHYHLLLRPLIDNGISLFVQKISGGYTSYFNLKHNRSGVLFQGRYKIKLIDEDLYARHVQAYIALNALDNIMPKWREDGIKNIRKAKEVLISYPWSSFSSYVGKNKFPGIINPKFIKDFFDDGKDYERFILSRSVEELSSAGVNTGVGPL